MKRYNIKDLLDIIKRLRSKKGCPWDRKQTHLSLCNGLIEETYEFIDAVYNNNKNNMKEELGDILLHIVFQSQIAKERREFSFNDVVDSICRKLIRRHEHVFGNKKVKNILEVKKQWEKVKEEEKKDRKSVMDGIPSLLPGLIYTEHILKQAYKAGFKWESKNSIIKKVVEEWKEFLYQIKYKKNKKRLEEEGGDLLFVFVNLLIELGINPERCILNAGKKFIKRFRKMESIIQKSKKKKINISEWRSMWKKVKKDLS